MNGLGLQGVIMRDFTKSSYYIDVYQLWDLS